MPRYSFDPQQSLERWQIIFFTTSAILLVELIVYTLLASGEEQPWNRAYTSGGTDGKNGARLSPEEEKLNKTTRAWSSYSIINNANKL